MCRFSATGDMDNPQDPRGVRLSAYSANFSRLKPASASCPKFGKIDNSINGYLRRPQAGAEALR